MSEHKMSLEEWESGNLADSIEVVVCMLRTLADEIESLKLEAQRTRDTPTENESYAAIAAKVAHDLAWGTANVNISGVIMDAARADRARLTSS